MCVIILDITTFTFSQAEKPFVFPSPFRRMTNCINTIINNVYIVHRQYAYVHYTQCIKIYYLLLLKGVSQNRKLIQWHLFLKRSWLNPSVAHYRTINGFKQKLQVTSSYVLDHVVECIPNEKWRRKCTTSYASWYGIYMSIIFTYSYVMNDTIKSYTT